MISNNLSEVGEAAILPDMAAESFWAPPAPAKTVPDSAGFQTSHAKV